MKTMRGPHCVALAAGAWLLAGTGLQGLTVPFSPMSNAVVIAVVLVLFATLALVLRFQWSGWATLLVAAWAASSSSMLGATQALMPLMLVSFAGLALCVGLLMIALPRQRRRQGRRV
jgi:hypothetical protein